MALTATVFKVDLQVSDIDRGYYDSHRLTVARHPSETDERMMVRVLAFALNASPSLQFTRGLSTDDEPDLWEIDDTGAVAHWIEVGLPDERRLKRAAQRSARTTVYAFGGRGVATWWRDLERVAARYDTLTVARLPKEATEALAKMAQRTMTLSVTIQEGRALVTDGTGVLDVSIETLTPS